MKYFTIKELKDETAVQILEEAAKKGSNALDESFGSVPFNDNIKLIIGLALIVAEMREVKP